MDANTFISQTVVVCNVRYPPQPQYSEQVWRDVSRLLPAAARGSGHAVRHVIYPVHTDELHIAKDAVSNAAVVTFSSREVAEAFQALNPLQHRFIPAQRLPCRTELVEPRGFRSVPHSRVVGVAETLRRLHGVQAAPDHRGVSVTGFTFQVTFAKAVLLGSLCGGSRGSGEAGYPHAVTVPCEGGAYVPAHFQTTSSEYGLQTCGGHLLEEKLVTAPINMKYISGRGYLSRVEDKFNVKVDLDMDLDNDSGFVIKAENAQVLEAASRRLEGFVRECQLQPLACVRYDPVAGYMAELEGLLAEMEQANTDTAFWDNKIGEVWILGEKANVCYQEIIKNFPELRGNSVWGNNARNNLGRGSLRLPYNSDYHIRTGSAMQERTVNRLETVTIPVNTDLMLYIGFAKRSTLEDIEDSCGVRIDHEKVGASSQFIIVCKHHNAKFDIRRAERQLRDMIARYEPAITSEYINDIPYSPRFADDLQSFRENKYRTNAYIGCEDEKSVHIVADRDLVLEVKSELQKTYGLNPPPAHPDHVPTGIRSSRVCVTDRPAASSAAHYRTRQPLYTERGHASNRSMLRLTNPVVDLDVEETGRFVAGPADVLPASYSVNGVKVHVFVDEITALRVDGVVNPTAGDLDHSGGAARQIAATAGPQMALECQQHVRRFGPLPVGQCCTTSGGRLPCRGVIHVAVTDPRWSVGGEELSRAVSAAVSAAVSMAADRRYGSVAVPRMSNGLPLPELAALTVRTLTHHLTTQPPSSLQHLYLVDSSPDYTALLQQQLEQQTAAVVRLQTFCAPAIVNSDHVDFLAARGRVASGTGGVNGYSGSRAVSGYCRDHVASPVLAGTAGYTGGPLPDARRRRTVPTEPVSMFGKYY